MNAKSIPLPKFVVCSLLFALILLMSFTPIGFLTIGPVSITLVQLPVLVGLLCEGLGVGMILGAAFGIVSLLRALAPAGILDPFFLNPLVSILPRLLVPLLAWAAYRGLWRVLARWPKQRPWLSYAGSALVGTLTNTVGVLLMLYLLYAGQVAEAFGISRELVGGVLAGIVVSNGIPEAIFAVLVVPPLVLAVRKATRKDLAAETRVSD